MDASFDQFAGGGWGEQGEQEYTEDHIHKPNIYDKIPISAGIEDLLAMSSDDEHYVLGGYSFRTLRVMGKIVNVHTDSNQCTTYEFCDAFAKDLRIAKRITVIRHPGTGLTQSNQVFNEGQTVQAIGNLQLFNNRLSIVSFHIREITMDEIEIFKMECKLARAYYEKNIPEIDKCLENTIFRHANKKSGTTFVTGAGNGNTPNKANIRSQIPTPNRQNVPGGNQADMSQFTAQQRNIFEFIKHLAETRNDGSGVHINEIRDALELNNQFENDVQVLQNEGKLYTTLDDEHFAPVSD